MSPQFASFQEGVLLAFQVPTLARLAPGKEAERTQKAGCLIEQEWELEKL